jgi:hypothetical protein
MYKLVQVKTRGVKNWYAFTNEAASIRWMEKRTELSARFFGLIAIGLQHNNYLIPKIALQ